MAEDKEYEVLEEGNRIVAALRDRYQPHFRFVVPEQIVVLAVTNKPRPFSMKKLAFITKINAAHRTVIRRYGRKDIRYIIELYASDWAQWSLPRKQWILAHEIGHITHPDAKGVIDHDIKDFGWLLDAVGIDWWSRDDLPELLGDRPFPFRLSLFERLHVAGQGDDDAEGVREGGDGHRDDSRNRGELSVDGAHRLCYDVSVNGRIRCWSQRIVRIVRSYARRLFR